MVPYIHPENTISLKINKIDHHLIEKRILHLYIKL